MATTRSRKRRKIGEKMKMNKIAKSNPIGGDVDNGSKFMNCVADDGILFEIFLRLPDWRTAILTSFVCRRWRTLISDPNFIRSFVCHHSRRRQTRSYTLMFQCQTRKGFGAPFCVLPFEKSNFVYGKSASDYLSFMDGSLSWRSLSNDLLLVSSSGSEEHCATNYSICNPLTGQRLPLPEAPRDQDELFFGYALVCKPSSIQCQYKVVLMEILNSVRPIDYFQSADNNFRFYVKIFCSETGKWSKSKILYPPREGFVPSGFLQIVKCNGIIYGLESSLARVIVVFDPFNNTGRCYFIDFPVRFGIWQHNLNKDDARLGVVCGRLRIARLINIKGYMSLKIWELNYDDDDDGFKTSWVLLHNVRLKIKFSTQYLREKMVLLGFDPINGDVVYIGRENNIYQFNIEEEEYKKVGEFPFHYKMISNYFENLKAKILGIMHPIWPTRIPPLPSTSA